MITSARNTFCWVCWYGEGVAAQIIANRGLTAAQVRAEILKRIPSAPGQSDAANPAVGTVATGSFTYWPARAIHEIKIGENSYKIVATSGDTGAAYTSIEAVIASPDGLGCRTHTREDISLYVLDGSIRLRIGIGLSTLVKVISPEFREEYLTRFNRPLSRRESC